MEAVVGMLALLLVLGLYIFIPASMARRRNRSGVLWVLIGLVGSPFLTILLLLALGNAPANQH